MSRNKEDYKAKLLTKGCVWGHGTSRVYITRDGYARCNGCISDAKLLREARKVFTDIPSLYIFRQRFGQEEIENVRQLLLQNRLDPVQAKRQRLILNGCAWGHGPESVSILKSGTVRCNGCFSDARVLRQARKILIDLPPLYIFRQKYGQEAIDRMRKALMKPPSLGRMGYGLRMGGKTVSLDVMVEHSGDFEQDGAVWRQVNARTA